MENKQDQRQYAVATERNREPILEVLKQFLPPTGTVLEIASGTGEHAVFFAPRLPALKWQPSDRNLLAISSIKSWQKYQPSANLYPPIYVDVTQENWDIQVENIEAIVSINMIHIAPWSACLGLMQGAKKLLPKGGILYLYGPFQRGGHHTAPSNEQFDQYLKMQNSEWGVRHLEDVIKVGEEQELKWLATVPMPANNLSVILQHN